MNETSESRYDGLARRLNEAGATQDPAEVHGSLCGALCLHDQLPTVDLVEGADGEALQPLLQALRDFSLEGLYDSDSGFQPLLPDDQAPLPRRVKALANWCSGFVFGIASHGEFELTQCTDEVQEVVRDLTELSRASLTDEESGEEQGEADYAELVEYVRVGVQLIFLEMRTAERQDEPDARLH